MNLRHIFSAALTATSIASWACTGLIATPGATADGSALVTYAADSHTLYGELYHTPAADHPAGSMRAVIDWDTGKPLGEIPQKAHTYTTIGNMNEHGLAITESTWGGRPELEGSGMIDYGSLIYITLERARTAREAIKTMTDLVDTYGYASSGESFTIADPDEVWIMELIGKGASDKGAVWVALRVPDGYISGHANHSRIHRFDTKHKSDTVLYSPDVISFAKSKGYYSGPDADFSFSRAYAVYDAGALRGCDGRVWSYYNRFAPDMNRYLPWILNGAGTPLPLWVKPSRPLTAADLKEMMRDHFEGTPLDMTLDAGAGPYSVPYRWRPLTFTVDSVEYTHERAIATQQTGFSLVAQLRRSAPDLMKGILWFGVDDANTCVYIPMYSCLTSVPHEFAVGNGDLYTISRDAAFWVTNMVANQAYHRYSQMIPDIRRVQRALEDSIQAEVDILYDEVASLDPDVARRFLNDHSAHWARQYVKQYSDLNDYLLVKYLDGNVKREDTPGQFSRNPYGLPEYPQFPGYDNRYYRSIATDPERGEILRVQPIEQQ